MEEPKIFEKSDLDLTAIRAQDENGKWGSFTVRELLDKKLDREIIRWFAAQMLSAAEANPDGTLTEDAAVNLCRIREIIVGPLVKMKDDVPGV